MIIEVNGTVDLRSKLVDAQRQIAGKKVWIYLHNYVVLDLIKNHGAVGSEYSATICLPEMETMIKLIRLDGTEYCQATKISVEEITLSEREPDEAIFVKPTKEFELEIAKLIVKGFFESLKEKIGQN